MRRLVVPIAAALMVMVLLSRAGRDGIDPRQMRQRALQPLQSQGTGPVHGGLPQMRPRHDGHLLDVMHAEGRALIPGGRVQAAATATGGRYWPLILPSLSNCETKRPQIVDLVFALDAGEGHLGSRDLRSRILDVFLELGLVPGDAGILVGVRIAVAFDRAGLAAVQPVELRADLVLGAFADRMAGQAFVEGRLAGRNVLRPRARCGANVAMTSSALEVRIFMGCSSWFREEATMPPLLHRALASDKPGKRQRSSAGLPCVFRIAGIAMCALSKPLQTCLICHEKSASRRTLPPTRRGPA